MSAGWVVLLAVGMLTSGSLIGLVTAHWAMRRSTIGMRTIPQTIEQRIEFVCEHALYCGPTESVLRVTGRVYYLAGEVLRNYGTLESFYADACKPLYWCAMVRAEFPSGREFSCAILDETRHWEIVNSLGKTKNYYWARVSDGRNSLDVSADTLSALAKKLLQLVSEADSAKDHILNHYFAKVMPALAEGSFYRQLLAIYRENYDPSTEELARFLPCSTD